MSNDGTYKFTNKWFLGDVYSRGVEVDIPATWTELFSTREVHKALEIGSYEGLSTVWMSELFARKGAFELTCVDTWAGGSEHSGVLWDLVEQRFDRNTAVVQERYAGALKIHKLKMTSVEACAKLISEGQAGSFDLIYVDGSHSSSDVLTDAVMAYQLCKTGGTIIFDDYLWEHQSEKTGNPLDVPKIGLDSFTTAFAGKIRIFHGFPAYQLYCKKL